MKRRQFLSAAGAAAAWGAIGSPLVAAAPAAGDRRFVFIIQRGAADGLSTVLPTGDPSFIAQRGALAEDAGSAAKLDSMFALHPALVETAKMYSAGEALFVHAVASPYRDRSHFDGQNVLETGGVAAFRLQDGWMNRMLGLVPSGERRALALSPSIPTALRGHYEVASYSPSGLGDPSDDLLARVSALYESDPQLHELWESGVAAHHAAGESSNGGPGAIGAITARLLKTDARIAMIETTGWDTHSGQHGRLSARLRDLDRILAQLKAGLGPDWANTVVVVATEFGRTVRINGTAGTDHGNGAVAMLLGGAVQGGRVIADWPGLADAALYEGRDLRPTTELDSLLATVVAQHFALEPSRVMSTVFPDTRSTPLATRLIRS